MSIKKRPNEGKELPADWREQVLDHLNDNLATWEIATVDDDGKPAAPNYVSLFDDYAIPVKLIDGGEHLSQFGVKKGEVYGFALFHKVIL